MIVGIINNQSLKINQPIIAANSIRYLEADFRFGGSGWEGLTKYAHFKQGNAEYVIVLTDDKIRAQDNLNLTSGEWQVYLTGFNETGLRITTETEPIVVSETGTPSNIPVPPSVAEQVTVMAKDARDTANRAEAKADKAVEDAQTIGAEAVANASESERIAKESATTSVKAKDTAVKNAQTSEQAKDTAVASAEESKANMEATQASKAEAKKLAEVAEQARDTALKAKNSIVSDKKSVDVKAKEVAENTSEVRRKTEEVSALARQTKSDSIKAKESSEKAKESEESVTVMKTDIETAIDKSNNYIYDAKVHIDKQTNVVNDNTNRVVDLSKKTEDNLGETVKAKLETEKIADMFKGYERFVPVKSKASGEAIVISDSAKLPFKNLKVFGKSWQDGEPSVEEPQEIKTIIKTKIACMGDNLFNISNYLTDKFGEKGFTKTAQGYAYTSGYCEYPLPIYLNGEITLFATISGSLKNKNAKFYFGLKQKDGTEIWCDGVEGVYFKNVKAKVNASLINPVVAVLRKADDVVNDVFVKNIGITLNNPNEPHLFENGGEIELPYQLYGVPLYDYYGNAKYNYMDNTGTKWISDYVDFEKGVLCKCTLLTSFKANEMNLEKWYFALNKIGDLKKITSVDGEAITNIGAPKEGTRKFCSTFPAGQNIDVVLKSWWGGLITDNPKKWVEENPNFEIKVLIPCMPTPYKEIPLTQEELDAYKKLTTLYPCTTILNDKGAGMEVEYTADTKNYIDNKFTELQNAIISQGGNV